MNNTVTHQNEHKMIHQVGTLQGQGTRQLIMPARAERTGGFVSNESEQTMRICQSHKDIVIGPGRAAMLSPGYSGIVHLMGHPEAQFIAAEIVRV